MGATTSILTKADLPEVLKSIQRFAEENKQEVVIQTDKLKANRSGFITLQPMNRMIFLSTHLMSDQIKQYLPKGTRKLKNAKKVISLSLGCDKQSQTILHKILSYNKHKGYIQMNDCGFGQYIEMLDNGKLNTPNLSRYVNNPKINPQIAELIKHYNDLDGTVKSINASELHTLDKENVSHIYYKIQKKDLSGIANGYTNNSFVSELIITTKQGTVPLIVVPTSMYVVTKSKNSYHILSKPESFEFLDSISDNKKTVIHTNELHDFFKV